MGFVGNLPSFPAVTEFCKSVKNWQSYRHEFRVLLFWDILYFRINRASDSDVCRIAAKMLRKHYLVGISESCRRVS